MHCNNQRSDPSQQVFRRMTPVAGGLGLSLVIVGGFFAFYFIVVTRFKDSKCPSRTFTIAKCHLTSFKQSLVLLWSNTLKYRSYIWHPQLVYMVLGSIFRPGRIAVGQVQQLFWQLRYLTNLTKRQSCNLNLLTTLTTWQTNILDNLLTIFTTWQVDNIDNLDNLTNMPAGVARSSTRPHAGRPLTRRIATSSRAQQKTTTTTTTTTTQPLTALHLASITPTERQSSRCFTMQLAGKLFDAPFHNDNLRFQWCWQYQNRWK